MATNKFEVGSKVQFTGKFLRSTGQIAGSEGQSKWIVQACECGSCVRGVFVRTNQAHSAEYLRGMFTADELATMPELHWRHINTANLQKCR